MGCGYVKFSDLARIFRDSEQLQIKKLILLMIKQLITEEIIGIKNIYKVTRLHLQIFKMSNVLVEV